MWSHCAAAAAAAASWRTRDTAQYLAFFVVVCVVVLFVGGGAVITLLRFIITFVFRVLFIVCLFLLLVPLHVLRLFVAGDALRFPTPRSPPPICYTLCALAFVTLFTIYCSLFCLQICPSHFAHYCCCYDLDRWSYNVCIYVSLSLHNVFNMWDALPIDYYLFPIPFIHVSLLPIVLIVIIPTTITSLFIACCIIVLFSLSYTLCLLLFLH